MQLLARVTAASAVATSLLIHAGVATAAVPTNDQFGSAQLLVGSSASAPGSNLDASKETGEPNHRARADAETYDAIHRVKVKR